MVRGGPRTGAGDRRRLPARRPGRRSGHGVHPRHRQAPEVPVTYHVPLAYRGAAVARRRGLPAGHQRARGAGHALDLRRRGRPGVAGTGARPAGRGCRGPAPEHLPSASNRRVGVHRGAGDEAGDAAADGAAQHADRGDPPPRAGGIGSGNAAAWVSSPWSDAGAACTRRCWNPPGAELLAGRPRHRRRGGRGGSAGGARGSRSAGTRAY